MKDRPLAAASRRLAGKQGRPRKAESGHVSDTSSAGRVVNGGDQGCSLAVQASEPRLLSLDDAARYLGVSPWTVRDLEAAAVLKRVRIPLPNGGELRKILFDREDLDHLITVWKS
ncbi:MAG: helix-turn-helix domain-containing protein [candidate division NC10 bacterium]|nr:helix-turn-helix domain-containing protein [candidate division NC10 bacterium]